MGLLFFVREKTAFRKLGARPPTSARLGICVSRAEYIIPPVGKLGEQARKKLTPLLHPGEELLAAALFKGPIGERGPVDATARYQEEHGLDPHDDLAYSEHVTDGYLGVTETRLLLAKCPLWGSVKSKHVLADVTLEDCELAWYDWERFMGTDRVMHLRLPEDRFTSVFVPVTIRTFISSSDREELVREADAVVTAFGERATRLEPKAEWLK